MDKLSTFLEHASAFFKQCGATQYLPRLRVIPMSGRAKQSAQRLFRH